MIQSLRSYLLDEAEAVKYLLENYLPKIVSLKLVLRFFGKLLVHGLPHLFF